MILPTYLRNSSPWLNDFSRIFENSFRQWSGAPSGVRVYAHEGGWMAEVDYPGVAKDELSLKFEDGHVVLEHTKPDGQLPTYRLPLGDQVDPQSITASFEHGVLTLRLPKHRAASKTIEIL